MLVQPVRHHPADDVVLPPRLLPDLVDPRDRRVPVVDHVVIVEDHHARDDRQHPALHVRSPRLVVQPGVLLEVGDIVETGQAVIVGEVTATLTHHGPGLGRGIVGVDLIAHEEQQVRPGLGQLSQHSQPVGVQRIDSPGALVMVGLEVPGRLVGSGGAARAEEDPQRSAIKGPYHARRQSLVRQRPPAFSVEKNFVGRRRAGNETLDDHERVVMSADGERRRRVPEDRDLAGCIGLDPDRRRRIGHVTQQRTEHQTSHRRTIPRRPARQHSGWSLQRIWEVHRHDYETPDAGWEHADGDHHD